MMGALALAQDCGASETGALVTLPAALAIRKKLFGSAMSFYSVNEVGPEMPISVDEAMLALDGKGEFAEAELFDVSLRVVR